MNKQEQIEKLSEMIDNSWYVGDTNKQIAEMALTMSLHWNQDTKEAAPEMYRFIELMLEEDVLYCGHDTWALEILAKARGEA